MNQLNFNFNIKLVNCFVSADSLVDSKLTYRAGELRES